MFERGSGFFEKMSSFSWGKKEKEKEDLNKLSDEELEKRASYTITGKPDNDAARYIEKRAAERKANEQAAKKSPSSKPDFSNKKPYVSELTPESEFQQVRSEPKSKAGTPKKPQTINMKADSSGVFVEDHSQNASAIKYEGDSYLVHADNVPKKFNPDRQLEPGEDKRLVRQGHGVVARRYQPEQYQPRPIKGLIESGQGKEVILRPNMEVMRPDKPEPIPEPIPVPEPVPVPKKPEEIKFEKEIQKANLADVNAVVERYAEKVAEHELDELLKNKTKWFSRWMVRLASDGYYRQFLDETKAAIKNNRNILTEIEGRVRGDSTDKTLAAGSENLHYEILDKAVKAVREGLLAEGSKEIKENSIRNMSVDVEAGRLFADFALGKITSRQEFDRQVEARLVPLVPGAKKQDMYASDLYQLAQEKRTRALEVLAERYKDDVDSKLETITKEFGPEQAAFVRKFIEQSTGLDIRLAENARDMAQKNVHEMKSYDWIVDKLQNSSYLTGVNHKWGKRLGRIVANPILYAGLTNFATRYALKGGAVGAASALTFGGAGMIMLGTGVGAGAFMGLRAARERRLDIARREKEAVLGERGQETHELADARNLIAVVNSLENKTSPLTDEEKQTVAEIRAKLRLQTQKQVDLISVGKEEGERLKGKLVAETDLREALQKFWQTKRGQFGGATEAEQQQVYDALVRDAERKLLPQIEAVDKEVAHEIRMRGLKMGLIGGASAAFMTGVFGGHLTEGFDKIHDYLVDHGMLGGGASHWLGSNHITPIGELKHIISGHHNTDIYHGAISDQASAFVHGHTVLNLPPGYQVHDMVDHGHNFVNITGPDGHVIPGAEHIGVNPDGTFDPHAFDGLSQHGWDVGRVPGAPGTSGTPGSGGLDNWMHNAQQHMHNGKVETIHTKGFYDNDTPMHVDAATGKLTGAEMNELKLLIHSDGNNINIDASKLLENESYHGTRSPYIDKLLTDGNLKIAIAPDAAHQSQAILCDIDPITKQIKLPLNEPWVKDMFDAATGHFKGGIIGTVESSTNPDGSKALWWLNSMKGSGTTDFSVGPAGPGLPGTPDVFNLRNNVPEEIIPPFPLAAGRRQLDKDRILMKGLDNQTQDRLKRIQNKLNPKKPETPATADVPPVIPPVVPNNPNEPWKNPNWERDVNEVFYGKESPGKMNWDDAIQEVFYGKKPAPKQRAVTMEDFYGTNPTENRYSSTPSATEQAEKSSQEKAMEALKNGLESNNLKESDVDRAANEFNVSKTEILTRCLEGKGIDYAKQESEILRAAQLDRSDYNRSQILWQILERSMNTAPKKATAPEPEKTPPVEEPSGVTPGKPMPGMPEPLPTTELPVEQTEPAPSSPETTETAQADLVESLAGKFSKIDVRVNGDGQEMFRGMSDEQKLSTVKAFEDALKILNQKLIDSGYKGKKLKFEIGSKYAFDVNVLRIPADGTVKGIVKNITDKLVKRDILPKEEESKKKL